MVRKTKVTTTQPPLIGLTAPSEPEPEPTPTAPAKVPVPPPPEPKPQNANDHVKPQRQTVPSKPKAKAAPKNIHHHVLENEQIVECFGTLSEALFKQQELKQLGTDSITIESYAGKGPCRRKITLDIENTAVTKSSPVAGTHDGE